MMANGERELKLLLLLLSEGSLSLSLSKSCLLVTQPKAGSTQARWRHSHSLLLSKPDLQVLFDASAAAISHVPSSHVHLRGRGMALSLSLCRCFCCWSGTNRPFARPHPRTAPFFFTYSRAEQFPL